MQCPICKGPVWDNRAKKASGAFKPEAPDYACKDKACEGRIWPEKDESATYTPKTASKNSSSGDNSLELAKLACMVVSAEIRAGKSIEHPFTRVLDAVKALKTGLSDIYKKADPIYKPADVPEIEVDVDPGPAADDETVPF